MDIRIQHDAPTPPYRQLAAALRRAIAAGEILPGERIPSEAEIQVATSLARTTIRRAVALLVDEGVVVTVPRRGSYVAEHTGG